MPWHAKLDGGYVSLIGSTVYFSSEGKDNIDMMYSLLSSRGWTLEAISGVIGNICVEGLLNPWQWQYGEEAYTGPTKGYGLVQFTPAYGYTNDRGEYIPGYITDYGVGVEGYAPSLSRTTVTPGANASDGNAQTIVIAEDRAGKYNIRSWAPAQYKISWSDYKNLTDIQTAVGAWLYNYESPENPGDKISGRMLYANAVYEYISGHPPQPTPGKGLPIWLIKKIHDRNFL